MAKPGETVEEFDNPPISFGAGNSPQEKYGGFAYSLDYNLALMDPSRMTISFISETRKYDEAALLEDIITNGTKAAPTKINYCGDHRTFYGYPLKYSINRSPRGDILTVDYYDASIIELDNIFVVLNKEDISPLDGNNQDNPCPRRIFNLGREYVKRESGIPQGNAACLDDSELTKEVLYTNHELAEIIENFVPVDANTIEVLSPQDNNGDPDASLTYLENYHGTLREVLKSWGERMGFTFYWEVKEDDDGEYGQLTFLNLKDPLFYSKLKSVVEKMLGKSKSGGACNLLDSTEAVSMEQTFNKAVSARYENARIGDGTNTSKFMILDMFTVPVRGCATDKGRVWGTAKFKGDIHPTVAPWNEGTPQYDWRTGNATWYKEWDSPNYKPEADADDKQDRRWLEYQPKRPTDRGEHNDVVSDEFRDYIRLVKAASIGEDFFNAYVFFKAIKKSKPETERLTLAGYCRQMNVDRPLVGDPDDPNATIAPMNCRDAVRRILVDGGRIMTGGALYIGPDTVDKRDKMDTCCGLEGDLMSLTFAESFDVEVLNAEITDQPDGIWDQNGKIIIPGLVENKALTKILSKNAAGAAPSVNTPNVRLCRGTVLGADCLTVNVLDPSFKATQALYQLSSNQRGPCGNKNQELQIDLVDDADDVQRVNPGTIDNPTPADIDANGSPYVFTSLFNFGNSSAFDRSGHGALYNQLALIGKTAGRFWVSPELLTKREFESRSYTDSDIYWVNRLLDVNDSKFRSICSEFDPMAGKSQMPWSDGGESRYDVFWGTDFTKGGESDQKQLEGWEGEVEKEENSNCSYKEGTEFSSGKSDTQENTRAPNVEQMIEKIIEKTMEYSTELCYQGETMKNLIPAEMVILEDGLIKEFDDNGDLTGYKFLGNYKAGGGMVNGRTCLVGGHGYAESANGGLGPEIKITGNGIPEGTIVATPIIDASSIKMIVIENAEQFTIPVPAGGGAPVITVEIPAPRGGLVNFFGSLKEDTLMANMDSITTTNLNLRNYQKIKSCCCDDLAPGAVIIDKGEMLRVSFSSEVRKQIQRISSATNKTISSANSANLVKDYKQDNKIITFSTNLIPINKLATAVSPDAHDELDWIVDQVRIGAEGIDPTYKNSFYVAITDEEDAGGPTMANCMLETIRENYRDNGVPFEAVVLGIPEDDGNNGFIVKTISNPRQDDAITGCEGFMGAGGVNEDGASTGVNVREMKIEFVTPTSDDIGVDFECGKDWEDLTEDEQNQKLQEIQNKLIEYVKKRAYLQNNHSYEASVTIADNFLKTKSGQAVKFDAGGSKSQGIPNIRQGLEALSIKVDGNGQRVTVSVGTRKKLLSLRDPNFNLWRDINPRDLNIIQPRGGAGN